MHRREWAEEGRQYTYTIYTYRYIDNRTNIRCSSMHSNSIELESIMGMMLMLTLLLSVNSSFSNCTAAAVALCACVCWFCFLSLVYSFIRSVYSRDWFNMCIVFCFCITCITVYTVYKYIYIFYTSTWIPFESLNYAPKRTVSTTSQCVFLMHVFLSHFSAFMISFLYSIHLCICRWCAAKQENTHMLYTHKESSYVKSHRKLLFNAYNIEWKEAGNCASAPIA